MFRRRRGRAFLLALSVALVFALQSFLPQWAAALPSGPALDRFGNPLCLTDPAHSTGHAGLPDCCALGCLQGQTPPAPPPEAAAFRPRPILAAAFHDPSRADARTAASRYRPGYPRAPPVTG
ncbi:MAG: hypothetical protein M9945_05395 [Aquamicrobium sp.]|uniref:hypothetical protein n=1 Tax=Aquamicrobium sp. TaxID=1872579 RepID=UPI00349EE036|nr:hypothetical protein [Aquamicrobium sp.]